MSQKRLPCCICGAPLEVRETKKGKPYVICDSCGMQMFVRVELGIRKFESLVEQAEGRSIWRHLAELEQRYKKTCPECGNKFWIEEKLIKTGVLDGRFIGYRCPEARCEGIVKSEVRKR